MARRVSLDISLLVGDRLLRDPASSSILVVDDSFEIAQGKLQVAIPPGGTKTLDFTAYGFSEVEFIMAYCTRSLTIQFNGAGTALPMVPPPYLPSGQVTLSTLTQCGMLIFRTASLTSLVVVNTDTSNEAELFFALAGKK